MNMGGLDDLVNNSEEEKEKSKTEELMNELGVENKEELEELDYAIDTLLEIVLTQDKRIEELESKVLLLEAAIKNTLSEPNDNDNNEDNEDGLKWQ